VLGHGGMGVVYLARDTRLDRPVALKVVRAELAGDVRFRDWFLQESQLAAGLDHPSIVPVYSAGDADGVLYLAMRYVDGRTLREVLKDDGALKPDRALRIVRQLAAALDAAHAAGLVHRDVKPANVLLTGDPADRTEHAYLADFGLAKRPATADSVTGSGALLGTISYAAPEQIEGAQVDGRADIYSLGCLLFECLTGRPPFSADSDLAVVYAHLQQPAPAISTVGRSLPPALDPVVAKALAKKPGDRYRTAGAFVEAARAAFPGSVAPRRSRRTLVAAAALAVVGVTAAGVTGVLVDRSHSRNDAAAAAGPTGDQLLALDARTGRILRRTALP
jgi:serine/threonine-protein kinase